jgi:uncharacterized YigZ family protein
MKKKSDVSKNSDIELPKKRITLANNVSVETEEKKSIFIGHAAPIKNEEEARLFLESKRREYHDATHNCYAYILNFGAVARYSDDGEPSGTAGVPILNVLKMSGATDLIVVVTRYFGGILLGAGGLVRAYTASAKTAVDAAGFAVFEEYNLVKLTVSYSDYQKLTVALEKIGASEENCDFGENVSLISAIEKSRTDELIGLVSELTYGKGLTEIISSEERASKKK